MILTHTQAWSSCLEIIKDNVNEKAFSTWFQPILPISLENKVLTIQVPSQFFYEWLEEHYVSLLKSTIFRVIGMDARLEYRIIIENSGGKQTVINVPNVQDGKKSNPDTYMPITLTNTIKNPFVIPGIKKIHIDSQLNPNYTFESFIEGDCNRLARAAGFAIAQKPGGTAFNPLVVYSQVGFGKTHLVQAIGNQVKTLHPNKTVLYISCDKFISQAQDAFANKSMNDFVHFYQLIDVLIIDDIEFLANKEKTQDVFFNIFNHLHQNGKQIILTTDRAPKDLDGMEERLLSRFKWGLSADLAMPDYETRLSILTSLMHMDGIELPQDVVEFVAYNITSNVRELRGALISLLAHSSLNKKEIDIELAKKIIKTFVKSISREVSIEYIQKTVCDFFNVPIEKLKETTRKRQIVQARQLSMFLAKSYTKNSLKVIGKHFGNRDHSTVIHSCQTVLDLMDVDKEFRENVEELQKRIQLSKI
jgi:chromosomal replication initiator protein